MSNTRLSPEDWIRAALRCLTKSSIDEVRVERLARELGLSKGSFYWHFADRAALLSSMLQTWERLGTQAIIEETEAAQCTPSERLALLIRRVFSESEYDATEVAIRAWARTEAAAGEAMQRVDARRVAYVTQLIRAAGVPPTEAGRRAALAYRTLVGEMILRCHGAAALPGRSLTSLIQMLLAPATNSRRGQQQQ